MTVLELVFLFSSTKGWNESMYAIGVVVMVGLFQFGTDSQDLSYRPPTQEEEDASKVKVRRHERGRQSHSRKVPSATSAPGAPRRVGRGKILRKGPGDGPQDKGPRWMKGFAKGNRTILRRRWSRMLPSGVESPSQSDVYHPRDSNRTRRSGFSSPCIQCWLLALQ